MSLRKLFYPESLAIIGASNKKGKLGYNVLKNLIDHNFHGRIYPVNPSGGEIQGLKAYKSVSEIEDEIDAAVVIVPAHLTPEVVEECFKRGIKFVTVEAAGFGETGHGGKEIEERLKALIKRYGGHILGPNCTGVINVNNGLCESIGVVGELKPGNIGLVAQAGVYAAGILWGLRKIMDFSLIATIGNKLDLDETDILEFMGQDDTVEVITMYVEDIRDAGKFLRVVKRITPNKPVILLKGGRTEEGKAKAVTHTAAMGGSSRAYDTLFREAGVIVAMDNEHLFDLARAFSKQPLPVTDCAMVITYSGSQGITATDTLNENGMHLARLSEETIKKLKKLMPPMVAAINPADLTFDQNPIQVRKIIEVVAEDPDVGGIIANLQPEILGEYVEEMKNLKVDKPVLISVTGREFAMDDVIAMEQLGYPVFSTPERAAQVFASMRKFATQQLPDDEVVSFEVEKEKVAQIIADARRSGQKTIGGARAIELLKAYGIPAIESFVAKTPEEAEEIARSLGTPVAMKIESGKVIHKSDVGGVEINVSSDYSTAFRRIIENVKAAMPDLSDEDIDGVCIQPMARKGREVLIGATREDVMKCHVINFGLGGKYTEVFKDISSGIVPLSPATARRMIEDTKFISRLLKGQRGEPPSDIDTVVEALLRLSQLVTDFPEISEIEANPFMVYEEGGAVVDARLALAV